MESKYTTQKSENKRLRRLLNDNQDLSSHFSSTNQLTSSKSSKKVREFQLDTEIEMESQNLPEMSTLSPMSDKISKKLINKSMVISTKKIMIHDNLEYGKPSLNGNIEEHENLKSEVAKLNKIIEEMKKDHIKQFTIMSQKNELMKARDLELTQKIQELSKADSQFEMENSTLIQKMSQLEENNKLVRKENLEVSKLLTQLEAQIKDYEVMVKG